ncbi:MAG TPA: ABC transporter ATP-binding protein [Actinomycetota bacterium]
MESAIVIEGVSKRFRLFAERPTSIKERFLRLRRTKAEDFWALRDVSADIAPGRTLGLIGANGSGKTTLLKIIGGILRPTDGTVRTRGRIAALLELGAGFHPELTGRENVYLNASILGLSRAEVDLHFDEIVDFAELGRFIDNQVKHYSSGMFVRLGFAVAVHVDPEILLVDEVLAVGDEGFQQKCLARVRRFQEEGRTMVIVSHDVDLIGRVCDEAIMLDGGHVRTAGDAHDVAKEFRAHMLQFRAPFVRDDVTKEVEILSVGLLDAEGRPARAVQAGDPLSVQVDLRSNAPVDDPVVSIAIYDAADRLMFKTGTDWTRRPLGRVDGKRRVTFDLSTVPFTDGRYHVTVGVHSGRLEVIYDWHDQRYAFDIDRTQVGREGQVWVPHDSRAEEL